MALWKDAGKVRTVIAIGWICLFSAHPGVAAELRIHGSTTFSRQLMEPHKARIEALSGHKLTVIPNKSGPGITALLEGRADMAMISAPLQEEIIELRDKSPSASLEKLQAHAVLSVRVAVALHPSNSVRQATLSQVTDILTGKVTNWRSLGGEDAPIKVIMVGGGGGVTTMVEAALLAGQRPTNPAIIYVRSPVQLIQVVEQEPHAMGFAQLALVRQRNLPELTTDKPIEQVLSLVTLGPPSSAAIDACRRVSQEGAASDPRP